MDNDSPPDSSNNSSSSASSLQVADLEKSITVLPLINMSPDDENAFFADGVHEDILTKLSRVKKLHVISRTSTLGYKGTTTTPSA